MEAKWWNSSHWPRPNHTPKKRHFDVAAFSKCLLIATTHYKLLNMKSEPGQMALL